MNDKKIKTVELNDDDLAQIGGGNANDPASTEGKPSCYEYQAEIGCFGPVKLACANCQWKNYCKNKYSDPVI